MSRLDRWACRPQAKSTVTVTPTLTPAGLLLWTAGPQGKGAGGRQGGLREPQAQEGLHRSLREGRTPCEFRKAGAEAAACTVTAPTSPCPPGLRRPFPIRARPTPAGRTGEGLPLAPQREPRPTVPRSREKVAKDAAPRRAKPRHRMQSAGILGAPGPHRRQRWHGGGDTSLELVAGLARADRIQHRGRDSA